jgi:hypothetical protein
MFGADTIPAWDVIGNPDDGKYRTPDLGGEGAGRGQRENLDGIRT